MIVINPLLGAGILTMIELKMLKDVNNAGVGFTIHLFDGSYSISPEQVGPGIFQ